MIATKLSAPTVGIFVLVMGACAFLLFYRLAEVPFFGDETLYVRVGARTLASGDWAPLRLGTGTFVWKPPVTVWGNAAGMALLGENELGARLAVGCASLLLCALVAWFGLQIGGRWTLALAPLALVSAPPLLLEHGLRSAVPEAWLLLAVTASFVFYLETGESRPRERLGGLALLSCFSGWTKGLVGPVVVGVALFLVELLAPSRDGAAPEAIDRTAPGRPGGALRRRCGRAGATAFAAAVPGLLVYGAWLLYSLGSARAVLDWLRFDLISRSGPGLDPLHLQPATVYLRAAFDNFGIFALLAPVALISIVMRRQGAAGAAARAGRRLSLTLLLWMATVFVLFALPKSRLSWYVYPAYPALALATALMLDDLRRFLLARRGGGLVFSCLLVLLVAARVQALAADWPAREPHSFAALQRYVDDHPDARVFAELRLKRGEEADRRVTTWHRHYLHRFHPLAERALPPEAPACSFVVTAEPEAWRLAAGDRLAGVTSVRGELPGHFKLFVLDLCGGAFAGSGADRLARATGR